MELSGADIFFLMKELSWLENGKIEKIYQTDKNILIIKVYSRGSKRNLLVNIPGIVCFTSKEFISPVNPPGFCMSLRKHVGGARIKKVYQKGFERIIIIDLEWKEQKYSLIIELFKPGNVVLVQENKLINCMFRQHFKDRAIKHNQDYSFPPEQLNPLDLDEKKIFEVLTESDKELVKTLAMDFGLGGLYAEEILCRSDVSKDAEINEGVSKKIYKTFKLILEENISAWRNDKKAYPVKFESIKKKDDDECDSFSEAIDSFNISETKIIEKKTKKTKSLSDIQNKRIKDLEKESEELQRTGEFLYHKYQDFSALLEKIKTLKKTKNLEEIELELKKNKYFKSLDKKNKTITFEFEQI